MTDLHNAVAKTMNFVFADIESSTNETIKRINSLKANIGKVATISLDEIETNENIRKTIDTDSESFARLVESIKKYGILENVVVELRVNKKETDYKLVCIAGHRRILAAKTAKTITKVPCLLQAYAHKSDTIGAALAENLNREDLHCLDVAEGYKNLLKGEWSEEDLATHYCRDIRTIKHYLKMADWDDEIKDLLRQNPKIFSTRVIMRQFAYRKSSTPQDLKNAIISFISPKKSSPKNLVVAKSSNVSHDKKVVRTALNTYLGKQKLLSSLVKDEIKKAFLELKLI